MILCNRKVVCIIEIQIFRFSFISIVDIGREEYMYFAQGKYFSRITFRISLLAGILTSHFFELCARSAEIRAILEDRNSLASKFCLALPTAKPPTRPQTANNVYRGTKIQILKKIKVNTER